VIEPPRICTARDGSTVLGYLVVDSTVAGRAQGGLRLLPDVDEAELRLLAHSMTLKYGLLGLPQGGAKAGVLGDPEAPLEERRQRLVAFGRAIAPMLTSGGYVPNPDMGTDAADIRALLRAVGAPSPGRQGGFASASYTALTVFVAAERALRRLGRQVRGSSVAVEGFGKVGSALATRLVAAGARVVAISTSRGALFDPDGLDVPRLIRLAAECGSRLVDRYSSARRLAPADLLELPVELLCPCARHHSLHAANAPRVAAQVVCPGANNPLTPDAERQLAERGVLCVPDFVANCGGVLGGTMEFASVPPRAIERFITRHFADRVDRLLAESARQALSPRDLAERVALRRFSQVANAAAHPTPLSRLFALSLEAYRRGWLPAPLIGALAPHYFARALT
jgi:glutamate dehydrogenase (NAD(P)+)